MALILAEFYHEAIRLQPYGYGNRTTLDLFLAAVFNRKEVEKVEGYRGGIDFCRLTEAEKVALHDPATPKENLQAIFQHALDESLTPTLKNKETDFYSWPDKRMMLEGIPFLSHQKEDGSQYIVLVDGGLVPLAKFKAALETHLASDKPIAEFTPMRAKEYLPNTEFLRGGLTHIDGIEVQKGGAIPCCLDVDILTGLRDNDLNIFNDHYKKQARDGDGNPLPLSALNNNDALLTKLLETAPKNDERLQKCIKIAFRTQNFLVPEMEKAQREIFEDKYGNEIYHKEEKPKFFMTQGGPSSGKSAIDEVAKNLCEPCNEAKDKDGKAKPNYVTTSLDGFRDRSKLYRLLLAAGHHADDYVTVEPMALALRKWVSDHAQSKEYNVFYDGSGVKYNPRYAEITAAYKQAGYKTYLGAVDALGAENGNLDVIFERTVRRYEVTERAMPWKLVLGKHIDFPPSFMDAVQDYNLDKIMLFANDVQGQNAFVMAESFTLSTEQAAVLGDKRNSKKLLEELSVLRQSGVDAAMPMLQKSNKIEVPELKQDNVSYFAYPHNGETRILAIYDVERFTSMIKKAQKNPHAATIAGANIPPASMSFAARASSTLNGGSVARQ